MDAEQREALVARFRAYLEEAGDSGATEGTSEAEGAQAPDLYTLLAEVSALKSDVRRSTQQHKDALDQLGSALAQTQEQQRALGDALERERRSAARDAEERLLLELVELRERLVAGYRQATSLKPGVVARLGGAGRLLRRMAEGIEINLRQLDEVLTRYGVEGQVTLHQPFNPQTMHAVDTVHDETQPDGVVVEELRTGFQRHGHPLRIAEVIVNRRNRAS